MNIAGSGYTHSLITDTTPTLCGQNLIDSKDLSSYTPIMKKQCFIYYMICLLVLFGWLWLPALLPAQDNREWDMNEMHRLSQFPPLEGYPRSSLPPIDRAIIPPPPQSPMTSPTVPENRGAFNPQTGERYLPSGKGVYNPTTGEYYPPSGNGYFNTRTGEYYPRVDN